MIGKVRLALDHPQTCPRTTFMLCVVSASARALYSTRVWEDLYASAPPFAAS